MANTLKIEGEVKVPQEFSFDQLAKFDDQQLVIDVRQFGFKHDADAVRLNALLEIVGVSSSAKIVRMQSLSDKFQASVPLEPVRDTALVIFRANGEPLDLKAGGPFRFFLPNHVPCQMGEIDACANVKFVDHIQLLTTKD